MILTLLRSFASHTIISYMNFPVWWYTRGAYWAYKRFIGRLDMLTNILSINIWIKNWTKPMYGQYDIMGRLISFLMRTVQIVFRLILWVLGAAFLSLLFVLWFFMPIIIIGICINHILFIVEPLS